MRLQPTIPTTSATEAGTLMGGLVPDHPNSEIKSGIVVLWCIVPKYRGAMAKLYEGA
jgi:hypothetical protein